MRLKSFLFMLSCTYCLTYAQSNGDVKEKSGNPLFEGWYADPEGAVFGDEYWIYPTYSADFDEQTYMDAFSSSDLVHWTKHPRVLSNENVSWVKRALWAPAVIQANEKYYFFFGANDIKNNEQEGGIGVAIADNPAGPFKDALGKPLVSRSSPGIVAPRDFIDPNVFIDNDGTAYLLVGQNALNIIRLNEDMISYDNKPVVLNNTTDLPYFFEGIWMHKYDGKYYLSYSTGPNITGKAPQIAYATADSIYGPYTYRGIILNEVSSHTNHHSIVEYKDRWFLFFHTSDLALSHIPANSEERKYVQWRRSVHVAELHYKPDGTICPIILSPHK